MNAKSVRRFVGKLFGIAVAMAAVGGLLYAATRDGTSDSQGPSYLHSVSVVALVALTAWAFFAARRHVRRQSPSRLETIPPQPGDLLPATARTDLRARGPHADASARGRGGTRGAGPPHDGGDEPDDRRGATWVGGGTRGGGAADDGAGASDRDTPGARGGGGGDRVRVASGRPSFESAELARLEEVIRAGVSSPEAYRKHLKPILRQLAAGNVTGLGKPGDTDPDLAIEPYLPEERGIIRLLMLLPSYRKRMVTRAVYRIITGIASSQE